MRVQSEDVLLNDRNQHMFLNPTGDYARNNLQQQELLGLCFVRGLKDPEAKLKS